MAVDIGPKIGIQGEREFRQQIAQTNQALKTLAAEEKAVTSAFEGEADAEKKASAQKEVLNRQIATQKDKLALLERGLRESAQMYGEADTRTMKWQESVHTATARLNKMEGELRDLDKGVDETTESMEDAGDAAQGWADVMTGCLLAEGVKKGLEMVVGFAKDAAAAMLEASQAGAAYADDILTMATVTGLSTDTLQEYKYMADLVDVSLDTVTGSMTKLTSSMKKAKEGKGEAAEAFRELNVAVTDSSGKLRSVEDVWGEAITALGKIENEAERDAAAMTIFGKSAKDLNPLIEKGSDELDKLRQEAHDAGYVLSGSALTALGKQQDAMDRLAKKTEAAGNRFAEKLAPSMEKAYSKMGDVLDNPRVQRGLDILAQGVGSIVDGFTDLAAKVLPGLFEAFDFGDERLRLYNDRQIELTNKADDLKKSHEDLMAEYKDKAQVILDETRRTSDLWNELQKITDENGNVKKADEERAQYILNELNEALGTEYSMNDGIIQQYQTMQEEIGDLITQKKAKALLDANEEAYINAYTKQNEALQTAADLSAQVEEATQDLERAQSDYAEALEYANSKWDDPEDHDKWLRFMDEYTGRVNTAQRTLDSLTGEYETASETAAAYYDEVTRYEDAQAAILQGNYKKAVKLLADETGVSLEFYREKQRLNEEDKRKLSESISQAERRIAEYKKNLSKGLTGFSKSGLKELEDYVAEAKAIMNGEPIAKSYMDGLAAGLKNQAKQREIEAAVAGTASSIVRATKEKLMISSPSKVATWMGEMWDAGLIKGIEDKQTQLAKAAEGLADTIAESSDPGTVAGGYYGNALTSAPTGGYSRTSSYTTNLGGITVRIDGAGAVNEDVLAQRVAVRLTQELNRSNRARGG